MSLWLCLRFPQLAMECLAHRPEDPAVVIERQRVYAANDTAQLSGVAVGQSTATVRALLTTPELQVFERNITKETKCLEQLEQWAYSFTPTLERYWADSLQLEVGRCLKLHGDLGELLTRLEGELKQRGFTPCLGLAPNRSAAWLLSHDANSDHMDTSTDFLKRLEPLPLRLLEGGWAGEFSASVEQLEKAGFVAFGDILKLPQSTLGRRCGQNFQTWLDGVKASSDVATQDFKPAPVFRDNLWFGFEIRNKAELHPAMQQLLNAMARFANAIQQQVMSIEWQLLRARGAADAFTVRSSVANNTVEHWFDLSCLTLEQCHLNADVEGLALQVRSFQEWNATAEDLFDDSNTRESLHNLVDRLRSRLGLQAVQQINVCDAHLPEHSQCLVQDVERHETLSTPKEQRPFWLFDEPHPVRITNGTLHWNGPLTLLSGPERIEDNWWLEPVSRDYYIAQTQAGQPVWLFHDRRSQCWYVQGLLP